MKRAAFMTILVMGFFFITAAYGQDRTPAPPDRQAASSPKDAQAKTEHLRLASAKPVFSGKVVRIDLVSETLSLKGKQNVVTFDASDSRLLGYRIFSEIRVGDSVAVSYVPDGIKVARLLESPLPDTEAPRANRQKRTSMLPSRHPHGNGEDFNDIDANKDGKITAVELSILIPDITLARFRQHDVNSDGYLNKAEFTAVLKQQRATAKTR